MYLYRSQTPGHVLPYPPLQHVLVYDLAGSSRADKLETTFAGNITLVTHHTVQQPELA